jgi:hypothetical protein
MPRMQKVVLWICVLSIGVIAAASWPWLGGSRPIEKKPDDPEVKAKRSRDTREAHRLVDLKNEALADLENGQFAAADPPFFQLATAGTREPAGGRNWLISRIIALQSIDPKRESAAYEDAVERAQRALNLENALESKSPIRHYLAGKLAQARGSTKQRIFEQHIAAGTAPDDPVQWAELYDAQSSSANPSDHKEGEGTLRTLKDLAPINLYVQLEWLGVQSRLKDPQITDTLSRLRNLLMPLLPEHQDGASSEMDRLLNETQSAAKTANWETVARAVASLVTSARRLPEVDADRRRVQRDLSWFVVSDFSHAFYQKHRVDRRLESSGTSVQFQEISLSGPAAEIVDAREARFVDFDLDGRLDIAVLRNAAFEILTRDRNDQWTNVASIPLSAGSYQHFLAIDFGGVRSAAGTSAAANFVLFGKAGLLLIENRTEKDGKRRTLRQVEGAPLLGGGKDVLSVVARDLDEDGLTDLVVTCGGSNSAGSRLRVLRNQGSLRFEDITRRSELSDVAVAGPSLLAIDWDNDLDIDLLAPGAASSGTASGISFLKGRGLARFRPQRFPSKDAEVQSATALALLDADANGSLDLITAGPHGIMLTLTSRTEHGRVDATGVEPISDFVADGLLVLDYDNDGAQDLIAWNRETVRCFHGRAEGHFEVADEVLPASLGAISSIDFGDVDNDGDSDLVVVKVTPGTADGRLALLRNEGGNVNHWIDVRLDGRPAVSAPGEKGIPPAGLGSTLCLKSNAVCQAQIVDGPVTHFGIGTLDSADVLRILWTTGIPVNLLKSAKNETVRQSPSLRSSPRPPSQPPR